MLIPYLDKVDSLQLFRELGRQTPARKLGKEAGVEILFLENQWRGLCGEDSVGRI
jgi:hypothetical protein